VREVELSYEEVHKEMIGWLRRAANRTFIVGMTDDEILAEMVECLWKAWLTFDMRDNITLDQYFQRIWFNQKAKRLRYQTAQRRDRIKERSWPVFDPDDPWIVQALMVELDTAPPCPIDDPDAQVVWKELAQGATQIEVQALLSPRRFKRALKKLRDPAVREYLRR